MGGRELAIPLASNFDCPYRNRNAHERRRIAAVTLKLNVAAALCVTAPTAKA